MRRAFDIMVESEDDLGNVVTGIERNPLASAALAQLLRGSEQRDIRDGLLVESSVYATLQAGPEHAAWLAGRSPSKPVVPPSEPAVLVERDGPRLTLSLNRPATHNAYSTGMRDALVEGLRLAQADASIDEILLMGRGPSFCSGGDLGEFGTRPDPATAHAVRSARNAARLLAACADRLRADVHGACIGAGVELAAFARSVRARADAFFQLPEVAMGLIPGAGGTLSIPRRIGRQRTAYLALAGVRIDATTALAWGLIDDIAGGARM